MDKRAIWIIIGLMGIAMLGSVLLQVYWIRWSIKLSEEQLDRDVYAALNQVSRKLERQEDIKEQLEVISIANDIPKFKFNRIRRDMMENANSDSLIQEHILEPLKDRNRCDCPECRKERLDKYEKSEAYIQKVLVERLYNPKPLTSRIEDLNYLSNLLKQELRNRGIQIGYKYGVFSNREKSFIITNGHYMVSDEAPQVVQAGWSNLANSKYRVDLYPNDMSSPGQLLIYFPNKSSLLWGSVWEALFSSIVFTSIILFCFAYTIQVIFRQKKVSEMKTDFINNMTHEFKTPIATISLAADSISSPMILNNPDKVTRFANIIKQENKRMNNQVEKVLQMALLDKRDFKLKLTQVNLNDVIEQAVLNASLQVEKKGGVIHKQLEAAKPIIEGDLTHISNVIHNLLDNANKYSPGKPEITISTLNKKKGVQVTVADKGMGMDDEALKHIFDKFYRVHTGDLHDVKGFGLGLSYVKAMITAHKGQIDVKSEVGKGSSFILFFPFRQQNE